MVASPRRKTASSVQKSNSDAPIPWSLEEDERLRLALGMYETDYRSIKKFLQNTRSVPQIKARVLDLQLTLPKTPSLTPVKPSVPTTSSFPFQGPPSAFAGHARVANLVSAFQQPIESSDEEPTPTTAQPTLIQNRIEHLQKSSVSESSCNNMTPSRRAAIRAKKVSHFNQKESIDSQRIQSVKSSKLLFESTQQQENSSKKSVKRGKVKSVFLGNASPEPNKTRESETDTVEPVQVVQASIESSVADEQVVNAGKVAILRQSRGSGLAKGTSPRRSSGLRHVIATAEPQETAAETPRSKKTHLNQSMVMPQTPDMAAPVVGKRRRDEEPVEPEEMPLDRPIQSIKGRRGGQVGSKEMDVNSPSQQSVTKRLKRDVPDMAHNETVFLPVTPAKTKSVLVKTPSSQRTPKKRVLILTPEKMIQVSPNMVDEENDDEGVSVMSESTMTEECSDEETSDVSSEEEEEEDSQQSGWLTSVLHRLAFRFGIA